MILDSLIIKQRKSEVKAYAIDSLVSLDDKPRCFEAKLIKGFLDGDEFDLFFTIATNSDVYLNCLYHRVLRVV